MRPMTIHKRKNPSDYDVLFESVRPLVETLNSLNQDAVGQYTPVVDALVKNRSRDTQQIEQTLDGLLSFCGDREVLELYRRLCRHYYSLSPEAATYYVQAYRETWDPEEKRPWKTPAEAKKNSPVKAKNKK